LCATTVRSGKKRHHVGRGAKKRGERKITNAGTRRQCEKKKEAVNTLILLKTQTKNSLRSG